MNATVAKPKTLDQLCEAVAGATLVQPVGGCTKTALSAPLPGATVVEMGGLAGILEYEPGEYTFTAYAGTRLSTIAAALAEHGQFLPFDPPLQRAGATLGGTVASGLAGPGRYRYGGVRDFILGVRYVDGEGRLIKGGGKVVKNAAGFDTPKLMVGSLGMFGVLAELTFKVFPAPAAYATLVAPCVSPQEGVDLLAQIGASGMDVHALELVPGGPQCYAVWARLAGLSDALDERLGRLAQLLGRGTTVRGEQDAALWDDVAEFGWAPKPWNLVKIPLTPKRIPAVEEALLALDPGALRRYSGGGQVAWVATTAAPSALDPALGELGLAGLVIMGPKTPVRLGAREGESFERRVKAAMDPAGRFPTR
ncbi:MAG: FAD-binding protein [Anaerolineae bacterium]|nr:FAD-binding protein [Anaerolineae bacterium]